MSQQLIKPAPVRKTVTVRVAPADAFRVFTDGLDRWWPRSHHIGAAPMGRAVMEQRTGGRWYEIGDDGSECNWGEVLVWDPPSRLVLAWRINSNWQFGPDNHSEVEIVFTPLADGQTRVDLEHRGFEGLGDAEQVRTSVDGSGGWGSILESFRSVADA